MDSIALFLLAASVALAGPPEARFQSEQDEHGREASRLLDRGDYLRAIPELEKSRSLMAKAELVRLIGKDDRASRLNGITKFEPERMKALAESVIPEIERLAKVDPQALVSLSAFHFAGIGVPKDPKKGFALLEEADAKGVAAAKALLGASYIDGIGVARDAAKGARLVVAAAEGEGDDKVAAIALAGAIYARGVGVEEDPVKARQYLERAFRLGSINAAMDLAHLEITDVLGKKFITEYAKNADPNYVSNAYYLRAALAGRVEAKMLLASFERYEGTASRPLQGYAWVESAAESGLPEPLLMKACSLYEGWGCQQDGATAGRLVEEALAAAKRYGQPEILEAIEGVRKLKSGDERAVFIASKLDWKDLSEESAEKNPARPLGADGPSGLAGEEPSGLAGTAPAGADGEMPARRPKGAATEKAGRKPAATAAAKLRVIDSARQVIPGGGYVRVFGRVRNVSKEALDEVWVDVIFESAKGRMVAKGTGIVQPSPLQPGEVGTFEVMEEANPAASKYKFIFRESLGGSIPAVGR